MPAFDLEQRAVAALIAMIVSVPIVGGCGDSGPRESVTKTRGTIERKSAAKQGPASDAAMEMAPASEASDWRPLAGDENFAGKPLDAWAAEWLRWSYAQTSCDDPTFDQDGSRCGLYQDPASPVFFLATGDAGTVRTKCEVPEGKAILAPLAAASWDNAGVPEDAQLSDDRLEESVAKIVASLTQAFLRADGNELNDVAEYIVEPYKLEYTVPPPPNWFSCSGLSDVHGKVGPSYVGGAFVLLPPPSSGSHTLEYGATVYVEGIKSVNDVKATLTIR